MLFPRTEACTSVSVWFSLFQTACRCVVDSFRRRPSNVTRTAHTLQMSLPFVTVMSWLADHYLPLRLFSPMFMRRKTQLYEITHTNVKPDIGY